MALEVHISSVHLTSFRRFTDLTIQIPERPRLVVLAGPNGTGKSSLFDGFFWWSERWGRFTDPFQDTYHLKTGQVRPGPEPVTLAFHEGELQSDPEERKKAFYIRSAYRNDPDFSVSQLQRMGPLLDGPRVPRMIDNDVRVTDNYQRLVSATIEGVYSGAFDDASVAELREEFIGEVREAVQDLFPLLRLQGPGDPLLDGSFFFEKGASSGFHYRNLSGGEKAAFDLILDLVTKRRIYDDTVFCIDEPEAHMNTALQGALLEKLVELLPARCQLWIATHSIGMMRMAHSLARRDSGSVSFLDFGEPNFDNPVTMVPVVVDRDFMSRSLEVALGDLANLVAPERIVLCEGRPADAVHVARAEFDARCFRAIFGRNYPDTDYLSVGNALDVAADRMGLGRAIQTIVPGTQVIRVIDRDLRSNQEIQDAERLGIRVLARRHLESYLMDDEVLEALCRREGREDLLPDVIAARDQALRASLARGNDADDWKSAAGEFYSAARKLLTLASPGNTSDAFLADTLAPLMTSGMSVFEQLRQDIFGK